MSHRDRLGTDSEKVSLMSTGVRIPAIRTPQDSDDDLTTATATAHTNTNMTGETHGGAGADGGGGNVERSPTPGATSVHSNTSSTNTTDQQQQQPPSYNAAMGVTTLQPSPPSSLPSTSRSPSPIIITTRDSSCGDDNGDLGSGGGHISVPMDNLLHRSHSEASGMKDHAGGGGHDGHHGTDMAPRIQASQAVGGGVGVGPSGAPPAITYDEVVTTPSTPTGSRAADIELHHHGMYGLGPPPVESKSTSITPASSLLAVNKAIQLRESTLTVNYPENEMDSPAPKGCFYIDLNAGEIKKNKVDVENGHTKEDEKHHSQPKGLHHRRRSRKNTITEDEDETLLYARHERIPMKNFGAEIRASMDVENFLNQAVLLLDVAETSMEDILTKMLNPIIDNSEEPNISVQEALKAIFTHDTVPKLAKTIQGTCNLYGRGIDFDQSWICILCTMVSMQKRHVAIARLRHPANLGRNCQEVYFIILVAAPTREKGTKNALETGRTFATLFSHMDLRQRLLSVHTHDEFKRVMWDHTKQLADKQTNPERKLSNGDASYEDEEDDYKRRSLQIKKKCCFGGGVIRDFKRRYPHYPSDYYDGIRGHRTLQKTASTTVFLYFACLLPSIAFGMLNDTNTHGKIDVKKVIYSQTIGGLMFAFIGGQPLTILLTTAPLALYTKVIYNISEDWELDFFGMYACVGLWNMFFLLIYAFTDASRLMAWSTRSTEEIFSLFISIAFTVDAVRDVYNNFQTNYLGKVDDYHSDGYSNYTDTGNSTINGTGGGDVEGEILRENSLLFLLLMFGTVWVGVSLFNFTKTPYLNASKREALADYALPASVIIMSFFGSYVFSDVKLEPFNYIDGNIFNPAKLGDLSWMGVLGAMGLGFCLSLLFFMDQNISSAMVNNPQNKLKKGATYSWDLMIIGVMNGFFTYFGLPMVHGALPHSPLHARALADLEDYVEQGHVYQKIVRVRETRLTAVFSHILIGLSLFMLPIPLKYIPRAVLDGLFLYLAINSLGGNQMFERIMLLATEQAAYPPNHYIRTVPQRKVHMFTVAQLVQLIILCGFGFAPFPYMKMTFPILLLLLLPFRHKLLPQLMHKKFLQALDGH